MTATQEMTRAVSRVFTDSVHLAEANWRAISGTTSLGTMYELGFNTWKQWAELQMALVDACLKFGQISVDLPAFHDITAMADATEPPASKHRRVAASH